MWTLAPSPGTSHTHSFSSFHRAGASVLGWTYELAAERCDGDELQTVLTSASLRH